MSSFFYDAQTRRYLIQFMRLFSAISVRLGPDANGNYSIQQVPILYGDPDFMVAQLIKGASENTMLPSPMFSVYIDSIKPSEKRRQAPQFVGKVSTVERQFNQQTQTYGSGPGVRQDVERYMPSPYDFTFKLDVWTTNTTTKLQILEQIQMIFNPSLQLQQNSNLLDWTSIFECWLEDIIWTNRSIPQGNTIERDVMSLKFKIEGWINPPAKLKRSGLITEIVTRVFEPIDVSTIEQQLTGVYDPMTYLAGQPAMQIVTIEGNNDIQVSKGTNSDIITLLNSFGQPDPNLSWFDLIQIYGQITPGITKMRLNLEPGIEDETELVFGTIELNTSQPNQLLFTVDQDTLPGVTQLPVQTIIDPTEVFPGNGIPTAIAGQRYLLTSRNSTGEEPALPPLAQNSPWGQGLVAYPNDIIEYDGQNWFVAFDSKNSTGNNFVINIDNGYYYMFNGNNKQQGWVYTYYGQYNRGYWRIDNVIKAPNGTTINIYD